MLTIADLQQIAHLFDGQFSHIDRQFNRINEQFDRVDNRFIHIEKTLDRHSMELRALRRDQKVMLNLLDREQMFQRKRLNRVETHLQLPPLVQD